MSRCGAKLAGLIDSLRDLKLVVGRSLVSCRLRSPLPSPLGSESSNWRECPCPKVSW
jgi:hypothetical protein